MKEGFKTGRKRTSRKHGLYTPKAKQARVIAASLAGKSKSEIARTEHLKRETVGRILSQPEVEELQNAYRQQMLGLVPLCLRALEAKLVSKFGKVRRDTDWRMAVEILKGSQIYVSKQEQEVHEKRDEFEGRSEHDLRFYADHGRFPESSDEPVSSEKAPAGDGDAKPLPE